MAIAVAGFPLLGSCAMALSNAEQYLLELINRARLDPVGEAARYGIDLNAGLAAGTLGTQVRQVLAPNALLENAAVGHSKWMIDSDVFSHTETGGSTPGSRATAAGYIWNNIGENIAFRGTTGTLNLETVIGEQHRDLFLSSGHRVNMLNDTYREIGIGQEAGKFLYSGHNFNASLLTELFGKYGAKVFLTGVAYDDLNHDAFYSIGEGRGGITFSAQGHGTSTAAAGGYAIGMDPGASVALTGKVGALAFSALVAINDGNVKLDIVDGARFLTSGSLTLGSGINNVTLIGTSSLSAVGNAAANVISGNTAANTIDGGGGNDSIGGGNGSDTLLGNTGADALWGGGNNDRLNGGAGGDRLNGGIGADILSGGADRDSFIFDAGFGNDRVTDFSVASKESLVFDNALWGNAALSASQIVSQFAKVVGDEVVFEFSAQNVLHLAGVASTTDLAGLIQII